MKCTVGWLEPSKEMPGTRVWSKKLPNKSFACARGQGSALGTKGSFDPGFDFTRRKILAIHGDQHSVGNFIVDRGRGDRFEGKGGRRFLVGGSGTFGFLRGLLGTAHGGYGQEQASCER